MKALTYIEHGKFALQEKPLPQLQSARDAIVRVTLGSICTSDLHISMALCRVPCPVLRSVMRWSAWWRPSVLT